MFGAYGDTGLTPAMREIEDGLAEGELVPDTEMHALKSLERFQAKLARLIAEEPAASTDDLARQVHDAIRYTFWYGHAAYARGVLTTVSRLAELGYELQLLHNGWDSEAGQGISSRWRDPASGLDFELLFHTKPSWQARQQAQPLRDQIASPLTPAPEKERFRARLRDLYRDLPRPDGCLDLPGEPRDPLPAAPLAYCSIGRGPASRPASGAASGLLRRRLTEQGRVDESLRQDLTWRPTSALFEWEMGDVSSRRIALVSSAEADRLTARFSSGMGRPPRQLSDGRGPAFAPGWPAPASTLQIGCRSAAGTGRPDGGPAPRPALGGSGDPAVSRHRQQARSVEACGLGRGGLGGSAGRSGLTWPLPGRTTGIGRVSSSLGGADGPGCGPSVAGGAGAGAGASTARRRAAAVLAGRAAEPGRGRGRCPRASATGAAVWPAAGRPDGGRAELGRLGRLGRELLGARLEPGAYRLAGPGLGGRRGAARRGRAGPAGPPGRARADRQRWHRRPAAGLGLTGRRDGTSRQGRRLAGR